MTDFLQNNLGNLLAGSSVICLLGLSLRAMLRARKKGGSACGCGGCAKCPYSGRCGQG